MTGSQTPNASSTPSRIELIPTGSLQENKKNARRHSRKQIAQIADSIRELGFIAPIIIDDQDLVLAGHGRLAAARAEGIDKVPVIRFTHLTPAQKRAYALADNKLAEEAGWDRELLALELDELSDLLPAEGIDVSVTGFATAEIDLLLADLGPAGVQPDDVVPAVPENPTTRRGDIWQVGKHRLSCADSQEACAFDQLMGGALAQAVFTDPPYNVRIAAIGRGRIQHSEFAFASGEMTPRQFRRFLRKTLHNGIAVSSPGAVHFVAMDWRHIADLLVVGRSLYAATLNVAVWNKTNAGQGSFYRSQHEMIAVFRVGDDPHRNNIELGRFGRNRSNVWTYAGVNTFARERLETLALHPTVKPVALVADAMLDCTARGDIVLDQFAGSGTTILAAEKVGRIAYGIEYEPAYVDVAITRWQQATKLEATLVGDGRTFTEVAHDRRAPTQLSNDHA